MLFDSPVLVVSLLIIEECVDAQRPGIVVMTRPHVVSVSGHMHEGRAEPDRVSSSSSLR